MLYLVQIGTATRRGGFQELISMPVKSERNLYQVQCFYGNKYKGFDVKASIFEEMEIEVIPEKSEQQTIPKKPEAVSYLSDISIVYTGEERKIADKYKELSDEANELLEQLHSRIRSRYYCNDYVDASCPIELETNGSGTYIERLPINGRVLVEEIVKGGLKI